MKITLDGNVYISREKDPLNIFGKKKLYLIQIDKDKVLESLIQSEEELKILMDRKELICSKRKNKKTVIHLTYKIGKKIYRKKFPNLSAAQKFQVQLGELNEHVEILHKYRKYAKL